MPPEPGLGGGARQALPRGWRAVLFAAVLLGCALLLAGFLDELARYPYRAQGGLLLLSAGLVAVAQHCNALAWVVAAGRLQAGLARLDSIWLWFYSRLARYLPGKVAWVLVRFAYSPSKVGAGLASSLELVTSVLAVLLVVGAFVALDPHLVRVAAELLGPEVVVVGAAAVLVGLPLFFRYFGVVVERLTRSALAPVVQASLMARMTAWQVAAVLAHGASLLFLLWGVRGVEQPDVAIFGFVTAAYFAAGLIGMLAIFAPAGLGVREGVLVYLLGQRFALEPVVVAVLAVRLLGGLSEMLFGLLWLGVVRRRGVRRARTD